MGKVMEKSKQEIIERNRLIPSLYVQEGTMEKAGDYLGITKERIRQILKKLARKGGLDFRELKKQAKLTREQKRMVEIQRCKEIFLSQQPKNVHEFVGLCRVEGLRISWKRAKRIMRESGWSGLQSLHLDLDTIVSMVQEKGVRETAKYCQVKRGSIYQRLKRHGIQLQTKVKRR